MITLNGKNGEAKVFIDNVDSETMAQVISIMNHPVSEGSQVRIMPDCHAGKGCVVGTTMTIQDRLVPNIVGVDIGCGMLAVRLGPLQDILQKCNEVFRNGFSSALYPTFCKRFDDAVRKTVPCGRDVRDKPHGYVHQVKVKELLMKGADMERAMLSVGTLGGGNHFIELNVDTNHEIWLVVHTGSRHLGLEVAAYYQKAAENEIKGNGRQELIARLKTEGRSKDIAAEVAKLPKISHEHAFLARGGGGFEGYMHDMSITQQFASINRKAIVSSILAEFNGVMASLEAFETVHNYIDMETHVVRKGAVSAKQDERLLIPMNMQFGSLLCIGKGNRDWNYSAPHGAGRIMSRAKAKQAIQLDEFVKSMETVYSSTVNASTLDEAPMAYKDPQAIMDAIGETVEIVDTLKPIYNFKASE